MSSGPSGAYPTVKLPTANAWLQQTTSVLEDVSAQRLDFVNLTGVPHPEQIAAARVTAAFFHRFGATVETGGTGGEFCAVTGGLKPGVTLDAARAQLQTVANDYRRVFPDRVPPRGTFTLVPVRDAIVGIMGSSLRNPLFMTASQSVYTAYVNTQRASPGEISLAPSRAAYRSSLDPRNFFMIMGDARRRTVER
jgi:hypothetical protein